jgi:hypothetical protein
LLTTYLPWIGLVVAIAAAFARDGMPRSEAGNGERPAATRLVLCFIFIAVAIAAAKVWGLDVAGTLSASFGFGAGLVVTALAAWVGGSRLQAAAGSAGPLAFGSAVAGLAGLLAAQDLESAQLGLALGLGVGAWLFSHSGDGWAVRAGGFGIAAIMADILGRRGPGDAAGASGAAFGVAAALAATATLAAWPKPKEGTRSIGAATIAFGAVTIGPGWLVGERLVQVDQAWLVFGGGIAMGLAALWILSTQTAASAVPFALCAILWLGGATLAFGLLKGHGMALLLLGGASVALFAREGRSLLAMGPLAALVAYRVFREAHLGASRALDIGQHYGLIGILVGATLIVAAWEWRRSRSRGSGADVAGGLWVLLLAATPVLAGVLLGAKGFVGVLAGLGVGSVVVGLSGCRSPLPAVTGVGLAAGMTLGFGWMTKLLDFTRDQKAAFLYWAAPTLLVVAAAIAIFSKPQAGSDSGGGESA